MSADTIREQSARADLTLPNVLTTDTGRFHWRVEDLGIRRAYIKRGTPQLNGKVERSHRSGGQEFNQL